MNQWNQVKLFLLSKSQLKKNKKVLNKDLDAIPLILIKMTREDIIEVNLGVIEKIMMGIWKAEVLDIRGTNHLLVNAIIAEIDTDILMIQTLNVNIEIMRRNKRKPKQIEERK